MKVGDMVYNQRAQKPCVITKIGQRIFKETEHDYSGTRICTVVNVGEAQTTFALLDALKEMVSARP